ncbi:MAG: sodium:solute symporter family transporter [bacterium]
MNVEPIYFLFIAILYLILLFILAYYAERKEKAGHSIVNNPYVFSLSLAVYCSSWTFYGSVGKAATSGLEFLTIYIGPTLMIILWPVVLKKIIRIAKANNITTISDFIGSRYGKSFILSAVVTVIAVIGITPYLGLQIKAIMSTFNIITGSSNADAGITGLIITFIIGIFAIIFGARHLDSSERHSGIVFAIAVESIIKLITFLSVGIFVTYFLFNGFGDIFTQIKNTGYEKLLLLGNGSHTGYGEWFSLNFLAMMAIVLLPRQFQMAVVENYNESHINKAIWLFPLYLFLINIFVLPIAFAGILKGITEHRPDYFVLTLPLKYGNHVLSLLAFIGGFSAATSMIIVSSIALSTMIMHSIITPSLVRLYSMPSFHSLILNIKRLVILAVVFLGYLFAVYIGEFYSLVDIGLRSFEAVSLFAPAFFLGLYWRRGNKIGATMGMIVGFLIWFYTLVLPGMVKAGVIPYKGIIERVMGSKIFNPNALFNVHGLGRWSEPLLWSMLFNVIIYVGVSVFTKRSKDEEIQALVFVESYDKIKELSVSSSFTVNDIEYLLSQYMGPSEAYNVVQQFLIKKNTTRDGLTPKELFELRNEAETALASVIGIPMSSFIFENKLILTEKEREELSASIKEITRHLRVSRQELTESYRELMNLKKFSENIIDSAPVGIITVDELLRVNYWNKKIEALTGIRHDEAMNRSILLLLPWMPNKIFGEQTLDNDLTLKDQNDRVFKVKTNPLKDVIGGFVIIIEDISEKKKMEEQLFQASKLANIGKLTASIAHEIGNPLASIFSLIQELRALKFNNKKDIQFTIESLHTINSHIERISKIVRGLGDFARVNTSERIMSNVSDILDRTINLVRYDKRFKRIEFSKQSDDIPMLFVDPDEIQQVFLNLILNSLDAMPDGGRLDIKIQTNDGFVEIQFKDTGVGIDQSIIDKIFDPFFTTKPPNRGTGLGLNICDNIVKKYNGSISVFSKKGEGAIFLIKLPVKDNVR